MAGRTRYLPESVWVEEFSGKLPDPMGKLSNEKYSWVEAIVNILPILNTRTYSQYSRVAGRLGMSALSLCRVHSLHFGV